MITSNDDAHALGRCARSVYSHLARWSGWDLVLDRVRREWLDDREALSRFESEGGATERHVE